MKEPFCLKCGKKCVEIMQEMGGKLSAFPK